MEEIKLKRGDYKFLQAKRNRKQIEEALLKNPFLTQPQLAHMLGLSIKTISRHFCSLRAEYWHRHLKGEPQ